MSTAATHFGVALELSGVRLSRMTRSMTAGAAALLMTGLAWAEPKVVGDWPAEISALACTDGGNIYILEGKGKAAPLKAGDRPALSLDGALIAFGTTNDKAEPPAPRRTVEIIADQGAGKPVVPFPDKTSFGAQWSPDGRFLAVNAMTENGDESGWAVWTCDMKDGKTRLASKGVPFTGGTFLASWAGPISLLVHDMKTLYEVGADGTKMRSWPLEKLVNGLPMASDTKFVFTPDRRYLYFSAAESPQDDAKSFVYKVAVEAGQPMQVCEGSDFQIIADGVLLVAVTHNDSPSIALHREKDKTTKTLVEFAWAPSAAIK